MLSPMKTLDALIGELDNTLRTVSGSNHASRPSPGRALASASLDPAARELAGALMRVNHVGEVCAQALYRAQAVSTRDPELRRHFENAAREETDHLAWTRERLDQLGARPSLLNPLWYAGAYLIGLAAGRAGDARSLGFVVETERQVEQHLAGHLDRLPLADTASRAIVVQMKADEARHAAEAEAGGAARMPAPLRALMRVAAKVMTTTAHRL
jgi:ubiquinone biosynthesis monooxygenase Coq7